MAFDLDEDKLHAVLALDDRLAPYLSSRAGEAYWRAFILENRKTHEVRAIYRFRYTDSSSWAEVRPRDKESLEGSIAELRAALEVVQQIGLTVLGFDKETISHAVEFYRTPDDGGDPVRTAIWFEEQGLGRIEFESAEDAA